MAFLQDVWPELWLVSPWVLALGFFTAATVSALATLVIMCAGPVDMPRDRGSHAVPTPTSGGLAIMAGSLFAIGLILSVFGRDIPGQWRDGLAVIGFALIMGVSGALDDLFDWPAKARLAFQIVLCLAFAAIYPVDILVFGPGLDVQLPPLVGWLGSAAWLVLGVNAINFMDGANGLAPGTQTIALTVFAALILLLGPTAYLAPYLSIFLVLCVATAGAHAGFLPFNMPMGKVFQGDAGSLFGGALITGMTLVLRTYEIGSAWLGGFLLAPILVDVVLTLAVRTRQRKDVFRPHKEHLYQLWLIHKDPSHMRLAFIVWGLCAVSSLVGVVARVVDHATGWDIRFACLCVVISGYSVLWARVRRRLLMGGHKA